MAKKATTTTEEQGTGAPAAEPATTTAEATTFAEPLPEGLGGEGSSYVPAMRQGNMLAASDDALPIDMTGVRPPYLTITHGVGGGAEKFNPGDLVLAKENLVCPKGSALEVVILKVDQYLKQRLTNDEWNAGIRPQTFKTKEDAKAAGFRTEWENNVGPDVSPAMDIGLLIRKPTDVVCALFGIDSIDDHAYALAILSLDKTAYSYAINDIANILRFRLAKTGAHSALWELNTELSRPAKRTNNRTQIVRFKFRDMLPDDTVRNIEGALGAPSNG